MSTSRETTGAVGLRAAIRRAAAAGAAALALAGLGAAAGAGALPTSAAAQGADTFAPAAFVDGRAITSFDVDQRLRLLRFVGLPSVSREAALQSMIDDQLKRAAADAAGIRVSREDVDRGLARFGQAQDLTAATLEARLKREGISLIAVREYIETEVMWSSLVRRDYGVGEEVTERELNDEIAANGLDRTVSYALGEIAIPAGGDRAAAGALAEEVVAELRAGGDFSALARRHSRAPSARNGGRLGDVPQDRLPPGLVNVLSSLDPGDVTEPFEVQGGFVILTIFDRTETPRELTEADREAISARLLDQRLSRRAEGRLAELRAQAYVDRL